MKNFRPGKHVTDLIFTIALFGVFTISALAVIVAGANVYQHTTAAMEDNYTSRTALTYITEKLRKNDAGNNILVRTIEEHPVLTIETLVNETGYTTYIYEYEGILKEITAKSSLDIHLKDGQALLEVSGFSIEETEPGFFKCCVTDSQNVTNDAFIRLKSSLN